MDTERWVECDQRATECPEDPEIVGSIESLAKYLTEPFETDVEKHRVIFRWVADHISYNAKALQTVRVPCIADSACHNMVQHMIALEGV